LKLRYCRKKLKPYCYLALVSFFITLLLIIPVRLAIALNLAPQPQAFLVLGGDPAREQAAAELVKSYPSLKVWISSPPDVEKTLQMFQAFNIRSKQVYIDVKAVDTVTNFTSVVSDFKELQIQHIYLITSDFHMPRAKAIATLVLGSQGIAFTPISVLSRGRESESILRILRDIVRSLLWIITGHTGRI
jgi:uncharacterized SAM-binding protein YcdF (DUF218 family)